MNEPELNPTQEELEQADRLNEFIDGKFFDTSTAPVEAPDDLTASRTTTVPPLKDASVDAAVQVLLESAQSKESTGDHITNLPHIDGFEIDGLLGRGGMGVVYSAIQLGLNRKVAIKRLNEGLAASSKAVQRFAIETQAVARLQHPRIVPVYASGVAEGRPYYCMQWIDGIDLSRKLQFRDDQFGPMLDDSVRSVGWVIDLGVKIAQALQHAHDHYILHRDIKPANILIDRDAEPWVTDFGLAQVLDHELTGTSDLLGSLRYMSPEQVGGSGRPLSSLGDAEPPTRTSLDHRTDQYSLGVTLVELLSRRPYISAESPAGVLRQIVHGERPNLQKRIPHLSKDLETVLLKAIERDPNDRYESMAQFAADLDAASDNRPICAKRIGVAGRMQRWFRRNPGFGWSTVCGLAVTLCLAVGVAVKVAQRFADDNYKIRQQYASLLDQSGVAALQNGALEKAEASFASSLEVSPDIKEKQLQLQRLGWIGQLRVSSGPIQTIPGRIKAISNLSDRLQRVVAVQIESPHRLDFWELARHQPEAAPKALQTSIESELPVLSCCFSVNGKQLAVLTGDRTNENQTIRIYDPTTGKRTQFEQAFPRRVVWMRFTKKGDLLTAGWNGRLAKWDIESGSLIAEVNFAADPSLINWVYQSRMDQQTQYVAVALSNQQLCLVDIEEMKMQWDQPVNLKDWQTDELRFSADSRMVCAGGSGGRVGVWEVESGKPVIPLTDLGSAIEATAYSAAQGILAVTTADRSTHLFDLRIKQRIGKTLSHPNPVSSIAFDKSGRLLIVSGGNQFQVWSTESQRPVSPITQAVGVVSAQSIDVPDKKGQVHSMYRITRQQDDSTHFDWWSPSPWEQSVISLPPEMNSVAVVPCDDQICLHSRNRDGGETLRWTSANMADLANFQPQLARKSDGQMTGIHVADVSNDVLVASLKENNQSVFSIYDRSGIQVTASVDANHNHYQISPDGRQVAAGGFSKQVEVYRREPAPQGSIERLQIVAILRHDAWTTNALFTEDDRIVSGCWDGQVRIWQLDADDEATIHVQPQYQMGHRNVVEQLALRKDLLVVGTWSGEVVFWDIKGEPKEIARQTLHSGNILDLAIHPSGERVVSCGSDAAARLWAADGRLVSELVHDAPVNWAEFSPSGKTLATLSSDGEIRVWHAHSGRPLCSTLRGPSDINHACWFNDRLIVSGTTGSQAWIAELREPGSDL